MEKERRIKGLAVVALLIAVVGLTIAFAAMNRTLTINNTTAKVGKFDVRFVTDNSFGDTDHVYDFQGDSGTEDISRYTDNQSVEHHATIINDGSTVSGIRAQFNMTGVTAKYKLKIENKSAMRVELTGIDITNCSSNGISCNLVKADANESSLDGLVLEKEGDNGSSVYVLFRITASNRDGDSIANDITVNDLSLTVTFTQASASNEISQDSQGGNEISGGGFQFVLNETLPAFTLNSSIPAKNFSNLPSYNDGKEDIVFNEIDLYTSIDTEEPSILVYFNDEYGTIEYEVDNGSGQEPTTYMYVWNADRIPEANYSGPGWYLNGTKLDPTDYPVCNNCILKEAGEYEGFTISQVNTWFSDIFTLAN